MKTEATLKNLRITPRKVRLVTHSVIGMDAREALTQLEKQIKKSSRPIHALLKSALANAVNNGGLDAENLYVREIRVGDGLRLKRWLPRAFGRATPLLRRSAHVTVVLEEKVEGKNRAVKIKKQEKPEKEEAEVIPESELQEIQAEEEKEIKAEHKTVKPEKEIVKGKKPSPNVSGAKKMFQRKSM